MSKSEKILPEYLEKLKILHETLLLYIDTSGDSEEDYYNFNKLANILRERKILEKSTKLKSFLSLILDICNNHHRSPDFFIKIEEILKYLSESIKQTFSNTELFIFFMRNKMILLLLIQQNIITFDQNILDLILKERENETRNRFLCHFFYLEIKNFPLEELNEIKNEIIQHDPDYPSNFSAKCQNGENETYICSLIRNDEVKEFISYITRSKIPPSSTIKMSIYETNLFLIDKNPTLIEYAAFFGSIEIFQYLLLQNVEIDNKSLWVYSVHSDKAEIIHLLESNQILLDDQSKEKVYLESIYCHHTKLTEYFENNLLNEKNEKIISTFLKYHDYLCFPEDFENNFGFFYLCKYNYLKLVKLFLNTKEIDERMTTEMLRNAADENKIHIVYFMLERQTKIDKKMFENCSKMLKLSIPPTIETICEKSFYNCTSLTEIYIPSVKIVERCAFYRCSSLTKVNLPESVTSIGSNSFRECSLLKKISIPSSIEVIENHAFDKCINLTDITIPESVKIIGKCAFYGCSSLKSISLSSITSIQDFAFCECSSLEQVSIPETVKSIGKGAFKLCTLLKKISIPSSVVFIGSQAFNSCISLFELFIPNSIESLQRSTFKNCTSLTKISISSSVKSIGEYVFNGCSLLKQITISSSVISIGDGAFTGCSSLKQITIPSSATSIGDGAFTGCSKLKNILFEMPSSLKSIGENCFEGCKSLIKLLIPSSVTSYELQSFKEYRSLTQITIPSSLTSIANSAFYNCKSLTQITIPSSVTSIEDSAFYNCQLLTQITIPFSVTSIGNNAFDGCSSLVQITFEISSSIISIGEFTFSGCSSLTQITIPYSRTLIGDWAFDECSSLTQIAISSSVAKIGNNAFSGCSSLAQITIPSSVTYIGEDIFSRCEKIDKITIIPCEEKRIEYFEDKFLIYKSEPNNENYDTLILVKKCYFISEITYNNYILNVSSRKN